jgi:hypothetical protein
MLEVNPDSVKSFRKEVSLLSDFFFCVSPWMNLRSVDSPHSFNQASEHCEWYRYYSLKMACLCW